MADALVDGDVERAVENLSPELRRNLGEVVALLPLPASEATIESVDATGSGWTAVIRIVGTTEEVAVSTRWKDRAGEPTVVEISHLSREARSAEAASTDVEVDGEG